MTKVTPATRAVAIVFCSAFALLMGFLAKQWYSTVSQRLVDGATLVDAEVVRVERVGAKGYAPIFRFRDGRGQKKEYGHPLTFGDDWLIGERTPYYYYYYADEPKLSRPNTFLHVYGQPFLFLVIGGMFLLFALSYYFYSPELGEGSNYPLRLLSGILFLVIGSGLLYYANYERLKVKRLMDDGIKTTATVVRIEEKLVPTKDDDEEDKISYTPIFELTDRGGARREYRETWSSSRTKLRVGDRVPFVYHPDHYTWGRRTGFWTLHGLTLFLSVMGFASFWGGIHQVRRL